MKSSSTAVLLAGVVLALLAACGGGGPASPRASGSPTRSTLPRSAIAYSACMRAHGTPNYPDPDSNGQLPKADPQQLRVSAPQLQAAEQACQTLLPAGGSTQQQEQQCFQAGDCPQVLVQQLLTVERKFAQCMRSHGVPNWPDPAIDAQGRPVFPVAEAGMSRATAHSPQMTAKIEECQREAPSPVVFG